MRTGRTRQGMCVRRRAVFQLVQVGWHHRARVGVRRRPGCRFDDGSNIGPLRVEAADDGGDVCLASELLSVPHDVDDPGVTIPVRITRPRSARRITTAAAEDQRVRLQWPGARCAWRPRKPVDGVVIDPAVMRVTELVEQERRAVVVIILEAHALERGVAGRGRSSAAEARNGDSLMLRTGGDEDRQRPRSRSRRDSSIPATWSSGRGRARSSTDQQEIEPVMSR